MQRGKKASLTAIACLNSSGRLQLRNSLHEYLGKKSFAPYGKTVKVEVAAVAAQEHHARGTDWVDLQAQAKKIGWTLHGSQAAAANRSEGKAGVCIAARQKVGIGRAGSLPIDLSPRGSEGRLAAAWIDGVVKGGLLFLSLYLFDSEGLSDRNVELLERAGAAVVQHGGPWAIGGDFNMTPGELSGVAYLIRRMRGTIVAPKVPTCRGQDGGRVIDYFIIDERLRGTVWAVAPDLDLTTSPHLAVLLVLKSSIAAKCVRTARAPRTFPNTYLIGCRRPEVSLVPDAARLSSTTSTSTVATSAPLSLKDVTERYQHIIHEAEAELCNLFDHVTESDHPDPSFLGRNKPPEYRWAPVAPAAITRHGTDDPLGLLFQWFATKFTELASLVGAIERGRPLTQQKCLQWHGIVAKFLQKGKKLGEFPVTDRALWMARTRAVCYFDIDMLFVKQALVTWAKEARIDSEDRRSVWRKNASTSWNDWVAQELRTGAGALHRYTRRDEAQPDLPVQEQGVPTLSLQALVDHDYRLWTEVWSKHIDSAGAPWRSRPLLDKDQLQPITPEQLRKCAGSFAVRTGRGCEGFHPRWFGWLSDSILCRLVALLGDLETFGMWPETIHHIIVALIPNAGGGRRPIGLLPALVRLWERARRPVVAAWRATVKRHYNWASKGRSPQVAVWKEALCSEAAAAQDLQTGAVLIDLVKAFEMVKLELVWYAGIRCGFPAAMLKLVLESFSFARRLKCGGAYSEEFNTLSAVLAGGGYATDALFLVLVEPCDTLLRTFPQADICLFVDDLTIHVRGSDTSVARDLPAATDWCIDAFENELCLTVSRSHTPFAVDPSAKKVATFSHSATAKRSAISFRRIGVGISRQVKFLGIDYAAARRIRRTVQKKRLLVVTQRVGRYKKIGKTAGARILRTGAGPAMRYGASVLGTDSTALSRIRRFSCAVRGEMRRRSAFGRLKLASYDPAKLMAIDSIVDWAKARWDALVTREELHLAWKAASIRVGLARFPFKEVVGPAGALIASALRIGWTVPSP